MLTFLGLQRSFLTMPFALQILGTTLSTRSALRLLERFVERCGSGSAAIVNRGATRGDYLVPPAYRFEESLKHTLQKILP